MPPYRYCLYTISGQYLKYEYASNSLQEKCFMIPSPPCDSRFSTFQPSNTTCLYVQKINHFINSSSYFFQQTSIHRLCHKHTCHNGSQHHRPSSRLISHCRLGAHAASVPARRSILVEHEKLPRAVGGEPQTTLGVPCQTDGAETPVRAFT